MTDSTALHLARELAAVYLREIQALELSLAEKEYALTELRKDLEEARKCIGQSS